MRTRTTRTRTIRTCQLQLLLKLLVPRARLGWRLEHHGLEKRELPTETRSLFGPALAWKAEEAHENTQLVSLPGELCSLPGKL